MRFMKDLGLKTLYQLYHYFQTYLMMRKVFKLLCYRLRIVMSCDSHKVSQGVTTSGNAFYEGIKAKNPVSIVTSFSNISDDA
jgi:hypothetical protein